MSEETDQLVSSPDCERVASDAALDESSEDETLAQFEVAMQSVDEFCSSLAPPPDLEALFLDPSSRPAITRDGCDAELSQPIGLPTHQATNPPAGEVAPGARIGRFELIRELGSGGMGTVYLARDCQLGRRVAIKFFRVASAGAARRFVTEGSVTARCIHENIVVLHEVGELEGKPYMVFEYLQGQTLAELIRTTAPMSATRAVDLIVPVLRALICAHDHGIVHRDLKPGNILLTNSGAIKVLDFGIAKLLDESVPDESLDAAERLRASESLPQVSALAGTQAYMSPEQWGYGGSVDVRTDLWSVGITLFELLSGQHPFLSLSHDVHEWIVRMDEPTPSLRTVAPQVGLELASIVDRCLQKRKEDRPIDARSLLRALEPFSSRRLIALPRPGQDAPYAGLRSFQEADAARFFGRAGEIEAVTAQVREWPLLAVVGPSGIGKTSFVRAGVLPTLKNSGEGWDTWILRPGRDPIGALASLMSPLVCEHATVSDRLRLVQELSARLLREPGLLGNVLREGYRRSAHRSLIFIDQFEELYTLCEDPLARDAFTACLASAADDATAPVRIVVAIRSDFLGRVGEQDARFMGELAKALLFLGLPNQSGLRDAIVGPAEMMGYQFESPAIIDEMLEHLARTPGALPLLQFTVFQLWEARDPKRRTLTLQSYRELGGIAGALARHADSVIAKLEPGLRALARELFLQLVTPDRTRASMDLDALRSAAREPGQFDEMVDQLTAARLLCVQVDESSGRATLELVHESLIVAWPELRRWLDEGLEDENFFAQLQTAARQWSGRRDADLLWRGEIVGELRRFRRRSRRVLLAPVDEFVQAVLRQESRRAWHRRGWVGLGVIASIALYSVTAIGLVELRDAKARAEVSEEKTKALNLTLEATNGVLKSALAREQEQTDLAVRAKQEAEQNARAARFAQRLAEANARAAEANAHAARTALDQAEANAEHAKLANAELLNRLELERAQLKRFGEKNGKPGWVLK